MNRSHLRHQHGLDGIPWANALHHRDHEGEIDLAGLAAVHAGLDQLPQDALHRVAIGYAQCVRHQLFAELRVRMVDGVSARREFDPRGCGSRGLIGCGRRRRHGDVRCSGHVGCPWNARGARAGDRSLRAPVRCQLCGGVGRKRTRRARWCGRGGVFARFRNIGKIPLSCPTCQVTSSNAGRRPLLCMGLFSIFWRRALRRGVPATSPAVMPARHGAITGQRVPRADRIIILAGASRPARPDRRPADQGHSMSETE
ncbi:hypothetical protein ACVWY2_004896 [Bradyrhizobium sp. JR6.1]